MQKSKMNVLINFDEVTGENVKENNPYWPKILADFLS